MEIRMCAQRISIYFSTVFLILSSIPSIAKASETYDTKQVRTWTEWINTDMPMGSYKDDDETANSIRKRGRTICGGKARIDAVCRIVGDPRSVFNHLTAGAVSNFLSIPCTVDGILCRGKDQPEDRPCLDYEIRFECIQETQPTETNLGVIAVAAGLSVFVPIICVILMHVLRVIRERRVARQRALNHSLSVATENTDRASQTDLPPSYAQLFGPNYNFSSTETLLDTGTPASLRRNGSVTNPGFVGSSTTLSIDSDLSPADQSGQDVFSVSSGQLSLGPPSPTCVDVGTPPENVTSRVESPTRSDVRRTRFPGMHLSAFDLFSRRRSSFYDVPVEESQQTPPPTYLEAMVILAKLPPKSP